jgi:hypothetical protein
MKQESQHTAKFAVCINNDGYAASLEAGKLYRVIPDPVSEGHGLIRVVDESGEDYGYSRERFYALELAQALQEALKGISFAVPSSGER